MIRHTETPLPQIYLQKGMVAAVLGARTNLGNSAIPGIRYIKNIKLITTVVYIEILFMKYFLN